MKKYLIISSILSILFIIPLAAGGLIIRDLIRYAESPVGTLPDPVVIEIRKGERFDAVTEMLRGKGLITDPLKFKIVARYTGHDKKLKFGEYRLFPTMTPLEILARFTSGEVLLHRVTVPEGITYQAVADRVESAGLCGRDAFITVAASADFARGVRIPADTVEGYLFPDTYHFEKSPSAETLIMTMVSRFRKAFTPEWEQRAAELGLSVHEVVTLASIIEKETGRAEERAIISSVFHNRLKKGIPLASDPTVIYGIEEFDGNLTRTHLREKTPYNTYLIPGLPPGPIANPGSAALKAALYPADTKYLFFVAKPDRTHHFSTNYKEHSWAVREYQLPKPPPPALTDKEAPDPAFLLLPPPDGSLGSIPSLLGQPASNAANLFDGVSGLTLNPPLPETAPPGRTGAQVAQDQDAVPKATAEKPLEAPVTE